MRHDRTDTTDTTVPALLDAWAGSAAPDAPMPRAFARRVDARRWARRLPALATVATLALAALVSVVLGVRGSPPPDVRAWRVEPVEPIAPVPERIAPPRPVRHAARDASVRWEPVPPLRAGNLRSPQAVDSWFAGR